MPATNFLWQGAAAAQADRLETIMDAIVQAFCDDPSDRPVTDVLEDLNDIWQHVKALHDAEGHAEPTTESDSRSVVVGEVVHAVREGGCLPAIVMSPARFDDMDVHLAVVFWNDEKRRYELGVFYAAWHRILDCPTWISAGPTRSPAHET